jgi:hypothetical protein
MAHLADQNLPDIIAKGRLVLAAFEVAAEEHGSRLARSHRLTRNQSLRQSATN